MTTTSPSPNPIPSNPMIVGFNAIDRHTRLVLRPATDAEIDAWLEINNLPADSRTNPAPQPGYTRAWAFSKPVYVGSVLIDTDTGPGTNMLGMPLG